MWFGVELRPSDGLFWGVLEVRARGCSVAPRGATGLLRRGRDGTGVDGGRVARCSAARGNTAAGARCHPSSFTRASCDSTRGACGRRACARARSLRKAQRRAPRTVLPFTCGSGLSCVDDMNGCSMVVDCNGHCAPDFATGVSCVGDVTCDRPPPVCPAGYTSFPSDGCHGPCVPFATCTCTANADCPSGSHCNTTTGRCTAD